MTKPGWRSSAGLDGRGAGCSPLAAAAALPSTHRSAVDRSWQPARSRRLNARGDAGEWRTADRRSPVRYHRPCRRAVHAAGLPHLRRGQGSDERFTSGLGPELADRGITVNALRPGAVRTDLAEASSAPTTTGRAGRHPRRSSPPPPSSPRRSGPTSPAASSTPPSSVPARLSAPCSRPVRPYTYPIGSTGVPLTQTSQWRCGPVE